MYATYVYLLPNIHTVTYSTGNLLASILGGPVANPLKGDSIVHAMNKFILVRYRGFKKVLQAHKEMILTS